MTKFLPKKSIILAKLVHLKKRKREKGLGECWRSSEEMNGQDGRI
jgi:hypothetical protein